MVSSSVRNLLSVVVLLAGAWLAPGGAGAGPAAPTADEGMWTFDNLPLAQLKEKYGFEPSKEWIDHVRMSAVRFDTGGSGSFVSPNGLVMTNHHVALTTVQKLSNAEHDYVRDGFSAKAYGSEPKGPDLTIRQLIEIRDLTKDVAEATKDLTDSIEIAQARARVGAKAAGEVSDPSKDIVAEPVALYSGAELHLYVYKVYDDVRLVFAPEQQIAFFGGDPDNFTYPRYDLDCAFFRVYEDDKPIDSSKHYFKWSDKGAVGDELVFVPGNPGSTKRLFTYAQMEFERDVAEPIRIKILSAQREALAAYMAKGENEMREVRDDYFGIENSLKAFKGHLVGLKDAEMMAQQKAREADLVQKAEDPDVVKAIEAIAAAQKKRAEIFPRLVTAHLPGIAHPRRMGPPTPFQAFVQAASKGGPDPLGAEGPPAMKDLDRRMLVAQLTLAKDILPADDPYVKNILGDLTPAAAAERLLNSKLYDAAFRETLMKGGADAVEKSDDPIIVAIRTIGPIADEMATRMRDEVQKVELAHQGTLSKARFNVYGKTRYPDATFTLRLAYGVVKGYESGTTNVPYKTTFNGLYERNAAFDNKPPYHLPERWFDKRKDLALATPLNFVCTADIIGGNSGSPVINKDAQVVGLIFDGNIESLAANYWYDERVSRAVSVHSAGILEALSSVYGEKELIAEIKGG
jgi:hypothetical protein